jgi:hypothetical protein
MLVLPANLVRGAKAAMTRRRAPGSARVVVCCGSLIVGLAGLAQKDWRPAPIAAELFGWSEGTKQWRKQGDSAALQLSLGVLFDCAAHSSHLTTSFPPDRVQLGGNPFCKGGQPAGCLEEAEKAFSKAIKLDATLAEARARLAWALVERGRKDGLADLEAIYRNENAPTDLRYLCAMFLAQAAHLLQNDPVSAGWFRKASSLNTNWLSARLALAADVNGDGQLKAPLDRSDSVSGNDPWYTYRCVVLTPAVRDLLTSWIKRSQAGSGR